jgi:16S rRNA (guanine527-N7)-methyltransferase
LTSNEFRDLLTRRSAAAGVAISADLAVRLEAYLRLLSRWNARINLTALPVDRPTDETIDRLLIEPLAVARYVDDRWTPWFDIGSGGGSPAIPLLLAKPALQLTMVEARSRKAAFLREAIRTLDLGRASVENQRLEELALRQDRANTAGLVTVRAVKLDEVFFRSVVRLIRRDGRLILFQAAELSRSRFSAESTIPLPSATANTSFAVIAVPRGT